MLHQILSNLDFLDVVRTCVLSRRWRYVWASMPYLNFSANWFVRGNYNRNFEFADPKYKFWDFVKWSLLLRDDASQIIRLRLVTDSTMTDQLNGLLCVAAKRRLQELCILDGDYAVNALEFPRNICDSLTVLTLNFRDSIPLRAATAFRSLSRLSLTRVGITQNAIENLLSSECTKLEEINISATHLKNLTIVNVCTFEKFWVVGCFDSKIKICAPNLLSFCYIGPMVRGLVILDTVSLERVSICLLRIPKGFLGGYQNHLLSPASVTGLNYAKTLTLSSVVLKYFCPINSEVSWDAFLLDNLTCLEVEIRYSAKHIEGLINLLKLTPNLETLFIRFKQIKQVGWMRSRKRKVKNGSSWKSRVEDVACLSYNVKLIRISYLKGEETAIELLKFLLQNGRVLEKMEILHISAEMRRKYFGRLDTLPKASKELVISFPKLCQRQIPWFDKGDSDPEGGDD